MLADYCLCSATTKARLCMSCIKNIVLYQILVSENMRVLGANQEVNQHASLKDIHDKAESFPIGYTKKTASKNLKVLASNSMDLIETMADVFLDSPPEKHAVLKVLNPSSTYHPCAFEMLPRQCNVNIW